MVDTAKERPLSGYRVLDLTIARAGPTAVRLLADWGADVIRIEPPITSGSNNSLSGAHEGSDQQNLHRNKRGLVLDLKHPKGSKLKLNPVKVLICRYYLKQSTSKLSWHFPIFLNLLPSNVTTWIMYCS